MILNKQRAGFTALEVVITILILGILATLGQGSYAVWQKKVNIHNATEELKSSLVQAQQKAAASADGKSWGVHLEADRYTLFAGDIYSVNNPTNVVKILVGLTILNPTMSLSDGTSGYSPDVVFFKFTGQTVNSGTITLQVSADPTIQRSISISNLGVIQ